MGLDELLNAMDRTSANLARLEAIWDRAQPMIPTGPSRGSSREYEDLRRGWMSLLTGLPPIDGWRPTENLPDIDAAGQAFLDLADIGEPAFDLMEQLETPGRELDEYRFRLGHARRRAIRERLQELSGLVGRALPRIVEGVPRGSQDELDHPGVELVTDSVGEIERLLGDTVTRTQRWSNLRRHLYFGQGHDWHDIAEMDWPAIRADLENVTLSDTEPLPVPDFDLGAAAADKPVGEASFGFAWETLSDGDFERLLYELMRGFPNYKNVELLMKTNAPDRGRDLSAQRVIHDDGGTERVERVIIQAKHWRAQSVAPRDIQEALASLPTWEPPPIAALIIATSGRFTAAAVAVVERRNADLMRPHIELWPENRLESLLSARPDLMGIYARREQA
jgi:hypothetical protein